MVDLAKKILNCSNLHLATVLKPIANHVFMYSTACFIILLPPFAFLSWPNIYMITELGKNLHLFVRESGSREEVSD